MKKTKDFVIFLFLFLSFWYVVDEVYYLNDLDNFVLETQSNNVLRTKKYREGSYIEIYNKMFYFILEKIENY